MLHDDAAGLHGAFHHLPGSSADWLLLRSDGVLELYLRLTLRTDDGALIAMSERMPEQPPAISIGERPYAAMRSMSRYTWSTRRSPP